MDEKFRKCLIMMRKLVSDIQGAPYPGDDLEPELYKIWYEHVQKSGTECLEYLDANFPLEKIDISKKLDKFFNK
ncbi:MAG: hypothetical protein IJP61_04035 [Treponema sp.]|nr:hypothetical protein [Treponema sp.]